MLVTEIPPPPPPRHASIRMSVSSASSGGDGGFPVTPVSSPGSGSRSNAFFTNGYGSGNRTPKVFATQRWNLILSVFYEQMPLKRHWRCLWPYDDTFTGKEAVDFLATILPKLVINEKPIVRAQCFKLLQSFLYNRYIVNARESKNITFADSSSALYKFDRLIIEYEISKTAESSLNESGLESLYSSPYTTPRQTSPDPRFRRTASVRDNHVHSSFASATSSSSSSSSSFGFRGLFRSFRAPKRYTHVPPPPRPPPTFSFPPPPTTPPPPLETDRKRHRAFSPMASTKVRRHGFVDY